VIYVFFIHKNLQINQIIYQKKMMSG